MATRGIRNKNPLNIRLSATQWQGQLPREEHTDKAFCQFVSMAYGFRAAFVLLNNYITKHGCNTIEKIITRWAPPFATPSAADAAAQHECSGSAALSPTSHSRCACPLPSGTPKRENNTEAYILTVCHDTLFGGREVLMARDPRLRDIAWAMAKVECGRGILAYEEDLENGWKMAMK